MLFPNLSSRKVKLNFMWQKISYNALQGSSYYSQIVCILEVRVLYENKIYKAMCAIYKFLYNSILQWICGTYWFELTGRMHNCNCAKCLASRMVWKSSIFYF